MRRPARPPGRVGRRAHGRVYNVGPRARLRWPLAAEAVRRGPHRMDPLQSLVNSVTAAPTPAARMRALNALSTELARTGQAPQAFVIAKEARDIAARSGDRQLDAESLHALARCHFYLADFMPALEGMLRAAQLYQDAGDLTGAATAFAGIGLCQHRLGAHDDAVVSLLRALEIARTQKLDTLEIDICNSLGSALIAADRIDEAARYLASGIELAQARGDRNLLTKLLLNQSLLAKTRGDARAATDAGGAQQEYAKGLAHATQALELARALGNVYDEAQCLGQTGTMLRLLHSHADAAVILRQTLALGRTLKEPNVQAEALLELGSLHVAEGRAAEARQCLSEAIVLARSISARSVLAEACEALSQVQEQSGDFAGALAMYKEFHAVREGELAGSRKHAASAAQVWLDFQDASRRASQYRERAETLAADHAALARKTKVLMEVSQQDPLTGLLNRRGLDARIGALIAASEAGESPLTIVLIDVDRFKRINDTYSHAVGDAVLRRVAGIIRDHCRQDDLPVRYGGDEFLVVLAGADLASGRRVVERLKRASDAHRWESEAAGLRVTLSIGVAARARGATIAATVAVADEALYEAKAAGRDRIATRA
jgi:diguanylate cyclase (GGDEF)-like protein